MARTTFLQATALRFSAARSGKERTSKERTPKARSEKSGADHARPATARATTKRAGGQQSLLLSTTAQLRSGERATQQDAQRRARRRRQVARQYRQVEATIARVWVPKLDQMSFQWPTRLRMSEWQTSKLISALLLAVVVALVVWVHSDEQWFIYREQATFHGLTYVNADELYQRSVIDSWNIFWLSPRAIRERLIAAPTVADAQVTLQLPNQVVMEIQEEQPVALWVTQEGNFWLLPDGTALPEPEQASANLLQIIDPARDAKAWSDPNGVNIDVNVLKSAQTLTTYMPEVSQIYFNQGYGLNFHLPGSNVWVYWGDGLKMDKKYNNIVAIERHLRTASAKPNIIDLRFEKPVLK